MKKQFQATGIVPVLDQQSVEPNNENTISVGRYLGHFTSSGDQGGRLVLTPKPLTAEEKKQVEMRKLEVKDETLTLVYNGDGDVKTVLYKVGSSRPVVHVRNGGKRGTQGNQVLQNVLNGLTMEASLVGTKPRDKKRRSNKPRRSRPEVFTYTEE